MDEEPAPIFGPFRFDWPTREIWLVMGVAVFCATALGLTIPSEERGARPPWLTTSLRSDAGANFESIRAAGASASPSGASQFLVDPNTADLEALDALPGIGPVLGQRIIDARAESPFASPEDLDRRVRGIGPKILERIRPFLRFDSSSPSHGSEGSD